MEAESLKLKAERKKGSRVLSAFSFELIGLSKSLLHAETAQVLLNDLGVELDFLFVFSALNPLEVKKRQAVFVIDLREGLTSFYLLLFVQLIP